MKNRINVLLIFFLLAIAHFSFAQTAKLSIQGILRSPNGSAVENGTYEIKFKIYEALEGDVAIWEDTFSDVEVNGGVYSVIIGSGAALDVPFDQPYFLGVSVDGGSELIPRAGLTSSPYALSLIGSDNKFPNSGNVGVGAAAPQHKLTVKRGDGFLGFEADETANNTAVITTTANGMTFDAGGPDKIHEFNNGKIQATADEQFTVEGTDTAQIIFSNTSGSASLGFDAASGDNLKLSNAIGATEIEGTNITLNPTSGLANIEGVLDVNQDGEALKLTGTNANHIAFYPQGSSGGLKGTLGFTNPSNLSDLQLTNTSSNGNLTLKTTGGYVHVEDGLRVSGTNYQTFFTGNYRYYVYASNWIQNTTGGSHPSILAQSYMACNEYRAYSDRRIKDNFSLSDKISDLSTLNKIEVTDYQHIDKVANAPGYKKGFIAQQISSVFPEAVSKHKGHIPNIFCFPTKVKSTKDNFQITMQEAHQLKAGDMVKLSIDGSEESTIVKSVIDNFTFAVAPKKISVTKEVFVYGKEVDDFHTVDYDRIFTLNVSATQELARQVEALKKENAQLKAKSSTSDTLIQDMKADMQSLIGRINALEGKSTNNSIKLTNND